MEADIFRSAHAQDRKLVLEVALVLDANIRDLKIERRGRLREQAFHSEHVHKVWSPTSEPDIFRSAHAQNGKLVLELEIVVDANIGDLKIGGRERLREQAFHSEHMHKVWSPTSEPDIFRSAHAQNGKLVLEVALVVDANIRDLKIGGRGRLRVRVFSILSMCIRLGGRHFRSAHAQDRKLALESASSSDLKVPNIHSRTPTFSRHVIDCFSRLQSVPSMF